MRKPDRYLSCGSLVAGLVLLGGCSNGGGLDLGSLTGGGDNQVKIFNAQNGGNVRNFAGATDFIYAVGASPDGTVVAAGGQEGVVRVYNGASGALTRSLLPPDAQPPAPPETKKK